MKTDASSPPPPSEEAASPSMERLPVHLWEQVFSFLPVSTVLVSRAVCRLWDATLRSAPFSSLYAAAPARHEQLDDLHFLLFADLGSAAPFAAAYRPSQDRWSALPIPRPACAASCFHRVHASGGALVLAEQKNGSFVVHDLFAGVGHEIAPMVSLQGQSYALGLIDNGQLGYKIVAVSTLDRVVSQVFDSETCLWTWKGEFLGRFAVLGNSANLHGVLYCLSRAPDHLLAYELDSGEWSLVDVAMPPSCVVCPHLLVHRGALFLIGGEEEGGDISRIVMWELDGREKRWRVCGCMPDELLQEFRGQRMNHFYTLDRKGVVCFCNTSSNVLLMCDLRSMRWWWPKKCPFLISADGHSWFGHALEPRLGDFRCSVQFARHQKS
ncbi:hypothetical protein Taro_011892 [Colocasia esculenta]|uniref:F-box domain-containing protein n=1 Tax=Colocasia esculenta TaxID=4460 RepID=A0A843U786_COLES|nr:hypothetical protein [Colocasia esculenta]